MSTVPYPPSCRRCLTWRRAVRASPGRTGRSTRSCRKWPEQDTVNNKKHIISALLTWRRVVRASPGRTGRSTRSCRKWPEQDTVNNKKHIISALLTWRRAVRASPGRTGRSTRSCRKWPEQDTVYNKKLKIHIISAVVRIRDFYPGSEFFHPGSRVKKIPDPGSGSASKNLSIFKPKNCS